MKFEVRNKREQREGLVFKSTVYYCNVRIELTDDELEALAALAKTRDWKDVPIGQIKINETHDSTVTVASFYGTCKKGKGVWERGIRALSPEDSVLQIEAIKDIAKLAKEAISNRQFALNATMEETSEEI
ncbi:MAG: hypothetical protein K8F59_17025 [Rhodobacteraceae bacterium]|nr:hypothetical protein [Paracoccaceae bacterium]